MHVGTVQDGRRVPSRFRVGRRAATAGGDRVAAVPLSHILVCSRLSSLHQRLFTLSSTSPSHYPFLITNVRYRSSHAVRPSSSACPSLVSYHPLSVVPSCVPLRVGNNRTLSALHRLAWPACGCAVGMPRPPLGVPPLYHHHLAFPYSIDSLSLHSLSYSSRTLTSPSVRIVPALYHSCAAPPVAGWAGGDISVIF